MAKQKPKADEVAHIAEDIQPLAVPISELVEDPSNPRKHNTRNLEAIKRSLQAFGQRIPIVVNKNTMIVEAGNGRLEAAKQLGWSWIAAVLVDDDTLRGVSFSITDNRTSELADWNYEDLGRLFSEMDNDTCMLTGFDDHEIVALLRNAEEFEKLGDDEFGDVKVDRAKGKKLSIEFVCDDDKQEFFSFFGYKPTSKTVLCVKWETLCRSMEQKSESSKS